MDLSEALGVLLGAKLAAKVCAFLGAALMVFSWLRSKSGRGFGRAIMALSDEDQKKPRGITRGEWHDLRNDVQALQGLRWRVDRLESDVAELKARDEGE